MDIYVIINTKEKEKGKKIHNISKKKNAECSSFYLEYIVTLNKQHFFKLLTILQNRSTLFLWIK